MKFSKGISLSAGLGLMIAGVNGAAFAKQTPSGNLNVRVTGYEILGGGAAGQYTVNGLGQVIGDTTGVLDGDLIYTLVDAGAATEEECTEQISGSITAPSGSFSLADGNFTGTLTLTPVSSPVQTADCDGATLDLLCNRTLLHKGFVNDLDDGAYHCIATAATASGSATAIEAASLDVTINSVEGANAPTD
ncbi:MAG: hypothetical protein ABSG46_04245 [Candidatus Binataceae bacterium]|jgi:hypothetical protein